MGKGSGRKWQNWSSAPRSDNTGGSRRGGSYIVCTSCKDSWIWRSKLTSQRCCSRCGVAFEGGDSSSAPKAQGGNAAAGAAKPIVVDDDPTQFAVALLSIIGQMMPNANPTQQQGLESLKSMLLDGSMSQGQSGPPKSKTPQQEHSELMRHHDQVQSKLRRMEKKQGDKEAIVLKRRSRFCRPLTCQWLNKLMTRGMPSLSPNRLLPIGQ